MDELKTKQTEASVSAFLDSVENETRRKDGHAVLEMMSRITGEPAKMWGPSIIGFGQYHYRYDSGHEGDMCLLGFSPRKANLVLYVLPGFEGQEDMLARLGKHKHGKGCLYINKLADVDTAVLEELMAASFKHMKAKHTA